MFIIQLLPLYFILFTAFIKTWLDDRIFYWEHILMQCLSKRNKNPRNIWEDIKFYLTTENFSCFSSLSNLMNQFVIKTIAKQKIFVRQKIVDICFMLSASAFNFQSRRWKSRKKLCWNNNKWKRCTGMM